jgi:WD repeat-containing protein 48
MNTPERSGESPALTTPRPVPGALEIALEPQSCFNSEVYAADLGLDCGAEVDLRVNLGERLLHALFRDWAEAQGRPPAADDPPPLPFRALQEVPLLVTEGAAVLLRTSAAKLTRAEPDAVPPWVSQAVLHSQWTPKEPLKLSFFLAPHPSDDLPALAAGSNKLSAPKVLRMHKVAAYVANRLPNVDDPAALEQRLELLCNDKPLPMGMSLASVRAFVCTHGAYSLQLRPVLLLRTILAVL